MSMEYEWRKSVDQLACSIGRGEGISGRQTHSLFNIIKFEATLASFDFAFHE